MRTYLMAGPLTCRHGEGDEQRDTSEDHSTAERHAATTAQRVQLHTTNEHVVFSQMVYINLVLYV